jgi:hypothetical protein
LGDFLDDLVIVGGLVPPLLIPNEILPANQDPHVGTQDLDLGLAVGLLNARRYEELTERLRRAGFEPEINEDGNRILQTWKIERTGLKVTIDFLISPSDPDDKGGDIRHIEKDFGAVITPGLRLAFIDRKKITLDETTIFDEKATRDVWVCGPGAFVVLKALAFGIRGENKDAYDLYFVIRNYGRGIEDVYECLEPLLKEPETQQALDFLRRDFSEHDRAGPTRAALFLYNDRDAELQADVVGFVLELVSRCENA